MTDHKFAEVDNRVTITVPDFRFGPSNDGAVSTFRVGFYSYGSAYGSDTWVKGDPLSPRRLNYLSMKAGQLWRRKLRRLARDEAKIARHTEYKAYAKTNAKRFNEYRLQYLDQKFKIDAESVKIYKHLFKQAYHALCVQQNTISVANATGSRKTYRPSKRDVQRAIGFTFRQLKMRRRAELCPWSYVKPLPFPKRVWDVPSWTLFHNQQSGVPKKTQSKRETANFCNYYHALYYEVQSSPVKVLVKNEDRPYHYFANFGEAFRDRMVYNGGDISAAYVPLLWGPNDEIKLLNKLGRKWRKCEENLGNCIGESNQTYKMLSVIVSKLATLIEQLLRHEFTNILIGFENAALSAVQRPALGFEALSGAWLAFIFGLVPLIGDVTAIAEGLASYEDKSKTYRIRASHSITRVDKNVPQLLRVKDDGSSDVILQSSGFIKITKRYIAELDVPVLEKPWTDFLNKWVLNDITQVVWEVSPFSFIIDYFLHIQQCLEAEHVVREIPITRLMQSVKEVTKDVTSEFTTPDFQWMVQPPPTSSRFFERRPVYTVTVPRPELMPLKEALTPIHIINMVALLVGGISRVPALRRAELPREFQRELDVALLKIRRAMSFSHSNP